jgi:hypothetical protein
MIHALVRLSEQAGLAKILAFAQDVLNVHELLGALSQISDEN